MTETIQRLARANAILNSLAARRRLGGDPTIGTMIERMLVDRELLDLEEEILRRPGPLAAQVGASLARQRGT